MINFYSALVTVVAIYGISLPTGYAIIHCIFGPKLSSYPFLVRLPVYIAFGITMLIPMYLAVAFVKITVLTPVAIFLLSIAYIVSGQKAWHSGNKRLNQKQGTSGEGLIDKTFPFIVFIATATYFLLVVNYMKWPPAGDIISGIGPLVSLIEFAGKLPIEPSPILILYPPGFHVATATFNTLMKLYPAEAVLLMGTSVMILIPQLLYSLTYFVSRSKVFSIIAFFSSLLIHPSGHLEKWVVGYFFNGPYACLTGYLIIITFTNILVLLSVDCNEGDCYEVNKSLLISSFVSVSLIFTYPSFALLTIIYAVIVMVIYRNLVWQRCKSALRSFNLSLATKVLIAAVILVILAFLYSLFSVNRYVLNVLISYLRGAYFPGGSGIGGEETMYAYMVSPSFFFDNVNGFSILVAYPVGAYLTLKWKKIDVPLFFLLIATLVFVSFSEMIYQFTFYILPTRSVIILSLLSFPLILMARDQIIKTHKSFSAGKTMITLLNRKIVIKSRAVIPKVAVAVVAIIVFTPSLYGYFSFQQVEAWSWFSHQPYFTDDLAALEWINKNVKASDLILNDASYASMYLWSLSIKNLTHHLWTQWVYEERFNDVQKIWESPRDVDYIMEVLKKYDVRYVFSTSEWGYQLYGKPFGYNPKPYTPAQYAEIFDHYSFLKSVFRSGSTRVYEIVLTDIESKMLGMYDLESLTVSTLWNESGA